MSKKDTIVNNDLLVKYLIGKATANEAIRVEKWIKAADANRNYFDQLINAWEESLLLAGDDDGAALARLQYRINNGGRYPGEKPEPEAKVVTLHPAQKRTNWFLIAVALVFICGAAYVAYHYFKKPEQMEKLFSNNEVLVDTLADGSVVTLNRVSKLTYPKKFEGSVRRVDLKGEAFFKVAPDNNKPFVITVDGVTIKATGGSFNVKSKIGKTQVNAESDVVNVSKSGKDMDLKSSEMAYIDDKADTFNKETTKGKLYGYYATHTLICDQTQLRDLVKVLNEIFYVNIVIQNPAIEKLPITATFNNRSVDQILIVIVDKFNVSVEYQNKHIILK